MFFGGRSKRRKGQDAAVLDPDDLLAEIEDLTGANRRHCSPETDRELRRLRHLAGIALTKTAPEDPSYVDPAPVPPPRNPGSKVAEVAPDELTPGLLRAAILDSGCLLVRGLMEEGTALGLAEEIETAFSVRSELKGSETSDPGGYYDEFVPEPPFTVEKRDWIEEGGGVLATDSPKLFFEMLEVFEEAGLIDVIEAYLGERAAVSADKCTLRKATPDVVGAWHQDGKFMGDVRAMNVWLSLSRCGDLSPGMDLVPKRLDGHVAAGTEGTFFDSQVSQAVAEQVAGEQGIVRPIFNPGDALLFDDLFLHQTGSDPAMPNPRYAIESWFFGPSAFPEIYVPLAA